MLSQLEEEAVATAAAAKQLPRAAGCSVTADQVSPRLDGSGALPCSLYQDLIQQYSPSQLRARVRLIARGHQQQSSGS